MAAAATASPDASQPDASQPAASQPASPTSAPEPGTGINPWLIAAAVMLATFMEVLDTKD